MNMPLIRDEWRRQCSRAAWPSGLTLLIWFGLGLAVVLWPDDSLESLAYALTFLWPVTYLVVFTRLPELTLDATVFRRVFWSRYFGSLLPILLLTAVNFLLAWIWQHLAGTLPIDRYTPGMLIATWSKYWCLHGFLWSLWLLLRSGRGLLLLLTIIATIIIGFTLLDQALYWSRQWRSAESAVQGIQLVIMAGLAAVWLFFAYHDRRRQCAQTDPESSTPSPKND